MEHLVNLAGTGESCEPDEPHYAAVSGIEYGKLFLGERNGCIANQTILEVSKVRVDILWFLILLTFAVVSHCSDVFEDMIIRDNVGSVAHLLKCLRTECGPWGYEIKSLIAILQNMNCDILWCRFLLGSQCMIFRIRKTIEQWPVDNLPRREPPGRGPLIRDKVGRWGPGSRSTSKGYWCWNEII